MKTSARNVFQGRITSLRQTGIMVEVVLRTAGGLRIVSLITDESCRTLALTEGKLVNASVKAPWVLVSPGEFAKNSPPPAENCFLGVIEKVREDQMVAEVVVALAEGSLVCAIQSCCLESSGAFKVGQKATVLFKSFSVILNLD